ncbi:UDP-galactopyranose mutase [Bdellovibrio sp. HCB2-146]|uniref:UDP-galactopyranose mutase n=1 Tax=Bdellovibrio sp. HCB2-146 TaxID=3394362 RepID=UPI0039BD7B52
MKKRVAIVGAGFAGAVLARELAETENYDITIYEKRKHVAGNCHTQRDKGTDIMVHEYGPHIFNTSREDVWNYINSWGEFRPFTNRVKAVTEKGVFSLPVNLHTINQFFGKRFNPQEAELYLQQQADTSIDPVESFEDQALKFLGRDLYQNFFRGYTKKQWGVDPKELPASILKRLPVRFNYDDNYYNQKYQGIPTEGYSVLVERILDHPAIHVHLGKEYRQGESQEFDHLFWSGPIDAYFKYSLGRLRYRTLHFERFVQEGDFQGNAVMNYCEEGVPYTRISEHKHFAPWEHHAQTICFKEYSDLAKPGDTPFYPLRLKEDLQILERYVEAAEQTSNVTFIGRLGTYRYLDMHVVIGESLDLALHCLTTEQKHWRKFSQDPLQRSLK